MMHPFDSQLDHPIIQNWKFATIIADIETIYMHV